MPLLAPLVDGGLTETQPYPIIIVNLIGSKHLLLHCKNGSLLRKFFPRILYNSEYIYMSLQTKGFKFTP